MIGDRTYNEIIGQFILSNQQLNFKLLIGWKEVDMIQWLPLIACDHVTIHVKVHDQDNIYLINFHEVDIILIVNLQMTYDLTVYISQCRARRWVVSLSCTFQRAVLAALRVKDSRSCYFRVHFNVPL